MNFEHVGEPLAIIVGKDNKVKNPKVLYVSDNKDGSVHHSFNSLVVQ